MKLLDKNKILIFLWCLLILFMIIAPKNFVYFKLGILVILVILAVSKLVIQKVKIDKNSKILKFYVFYITYACLAFFIGYARKNPGVMTFGRFHIVYFTLMTLITYALRDVEKIISYTIKTITISIIVLCIYNTIYILVGLNIVPDFLFMSLEPFPVRVIVYPGYLHFYTTNSTMLIFLSPFFFGLFLIKDQASKNRVAYFLLTVWSVILIYLTGRRAFWLAVVFAALYYVYINRKKKLAKKYIIFFLSIS